MSETLSEAVHATQRVQLAIDLAKLKARQAQVVQAKRVWADGQRLRRMTRAALDRLQAVIAETIEPGMAETQVHARLSDAVFQILTDMANETAGKGHTAAFSKGVRPRRTLTVSQWADAHREIKTGTANPGPWRTDLVPYLREIMDSLSAHDPCQEVVIMKSAQGGGTEVLLNWVGYVASHAPAEMLMVMPTLELRDRFVKRRLRNLVRETAPVADALGGLRSRDAETSMGVIRFPGGGLILAGANAANSLRSDAVRYVACDEVDGFEWQVGGEGDPLELIENRQRTYSRRKLLLVSTPTKRGGSRIEQRYQQTDQRRYFMPCPHCGTFQVLTWQNMHWDTRTIQAAPGAAERREVTSAWCACTDCGASIEETHKPAMLAAGEWRPTVADAPKLKRGYHWSSIMAPIGMGPRWIELAQRWLDAQGDASRLQVFVNTYLGETWEDPGRNKADSRDIAMRAEPYAVRTAPTDCLMVTVGIDTQDNRLSVLWLGHGPGRQWWVIDWIEPIGDPSLDAVWDQALDLIREPIPHASGGVLRVAAGGVDIGGHHTAEAKAFSARASAALSIPFMAMQGSRHRAASVLPRRPMHTELTARGKRAPSGIPVWQVGTEIAKDRLYNDLAADADLSPEDRRGHFSQDLPAEFYAQLTSETYNPIKNRYEIRKGRRNEALDTWCYAYAAAHHPLIRVDKLSDRHWDDLAIMIGNRDTRSIAAPARPTAPAPRTGPAHNGFGSDDWNSRF